MKKNLLRTYSLTLLLAFLVGACSGQTEQTQVPSLDLTAVYVQVAGTLTAQGLLKAETVIPANGDDATAMPTPTDASLIFFDDFSSDINGWETRNEASAVTDYRNGEFVILVNKPDTSLWSKPIGVYTNVYITVDARQTAGPFKNLFGVICRYQDADNFYRFVVGADGYAGITKRSNGAVSVISGTALEVSNDVNQGFAANRIEAICQGSHLTLWVNGQKVAEAVDDQFATGEVGLIASSSKEIGVEIHFDNFAVLQP